jgi:phage recombination protein Bet
MNNTALTITNSHTIDMWNCAEKLKEIRKIICPSAPLTDVEFSCLVELGRATQLNPFMREIWAVKYKQGVAASIFIGRDGYRKAAQRDRDYDYHQVNAVYSKDEFQICNDEISHNYGFSNRGELVGAYCIVKRKSSEKYTYTLVTMDEYNLSQGLWKSKPETMIKKVAEAQALRQSFQDLLAGTYSDAELPQEKPMLQIVNAPKGNTQTERLKNLLNCDQAIEAVDCRLIARQSTIDTILELLEGVMLSEDRFNKALANYGVTCLEELLEEQAEDFITNLRKIYDKQSIPSG